MTYHLCFHGIGSCVEEREPGEAHYWIGQDLFLRVLDLVVESEDQIELSFDDGNRSDVDVALPALLERGLNASFFALAGRLDDARSLTAGDLQTLSAQGMAIGSHGWAHIPWRRLDTATARREFEDARSELQQASKTQITTGAFPLGQYDRQALKSLRHLDYSTVFTSDRFPAHRNSWLQARYSLTSTDTMESVRAIFSRKSFARRLRNRAVSAVKRLR